MQVRSNPNIKNSSRTQPLRIYNRHHDIRIGRTRDREKRQGLLESVLTVFAQPARKDRAYLDTVISFNNEDCPFESVEPYEGALLITTQVRPLDMRRMMMDKGSSMDILYSHTYQRLDLEGQKMEVG